MSSLKKCELICNIYVERYVFLAKSIKIQNVKKHQMKKSGEQKLSKEMAEYKLKKTTKAELKKNILLLLDEDSKNKKYEFEKSFFIKLCANYKLPKQMLREIEENLLRRKGNKYLNTKEEFDKIRNEIFLHLKTINTQIDPFMRKIWEDYQSDFGSLLIDEINKGNNTEKKLCHAMNHKKYEHLHYPKTPSPIRKILRLLESGGHIVHTKDRPKKYVETDKYFVSFKKEKKSTPAKP